MEWYVGATNKKVKALFVNDRVHSIERLEVKAVKTKDDIITIGDVWSFENGYNNGTTGPLTLENYNHVFKPDINEGFGNYYTAIMTNLNATFTHTGTNGLCAGMVISVASSSILNKPAPSSFVSEQYGNYFNLSSVKDYYAKSGDLTVDKFIKYAYIYQYSTDFNTINENRLDLLYNAIDESINSNGNPVYIAIRGDTNSSKDAGHALLAVGIQTNNNSVTEIKVYDCNHPEEFKVLSLRKNDNGEYVSWEYNLFKNTV